jgi:cell division protein FtsL
MYNLKEHKANAQGAQLTPDRPVLAAKRRRQLHPSFFHMGPVALSITSVLLIGLMAVLYLSQLGQAVSANQEIQDIHAEITRLNRSNQDLVNAITRERSPANIAAQAQKMGLVPADAKSVQILVVPHLRTIPNQDDLPIKPY